MDKYERRQRNRERQAAWRAKQKAETRPAGSDVTPVECDTLATMADVSHLEPSQNGQNNGRGLSTSQPSQREVGTVDSDAPWSSDIDINELYDRRPLWEFIDEPGSGGPGYVRWIGPGEPPKPAPRIWRNTPRTEEHVDAAENGIAAARDALDRNRWHPSKGPRP